MKLYHGSSKELEILEPLGLDFGNKYNPPGWSIFLFKKKEYATSWAIMQYLKSTIYWPYLKDKNNVRPVNFHNKYCKPFIDKESFEEYIKILNTFKDPQYTYVYECNIPANKVHLGNASFLDEYTVRESIKPNKVYKIHITEEFLRDNCIIYESDDECEFEAIKAVYAKNSLFIRGFFKSIIQTHEFLINVKLARKLYDDIDNGELSPGDDLVEYMNKKGYKMNEINEIDRIIHYMKNTYTDHLDNLNIEEQAIIRESIIFSKDNLELNLDKWEPGNPLFITGSSGDGKSTLAYKYGEEYNAIVCSTDVPLLRIYRSKEKFDKITKQKNRFNPSQLELDWIKAHKDLPFGQDVTDNQLLKDTTLEYVSWCIEHCPENRLLVIEGCDLISLGADYYIDKPLIVTGNSRLVNLIRRAKRSNTNHPEDGSFLKQLFDEVRKYITTYNNKGGMAQLDRHKEKFRKEMDRLIANQEAAISDWKLLDLMETIYEAYEDDPKAHDEFDYDTAIKNGGFWSYRSVSGEPCHTWNSLIVIDGKNYRKRVETIIIKGDKILLNMKKESYPAIPGGSTEFGKEDIDQAAKECQEEVHITVKNIRFTGQTYTEDKVSSWTKILPVQYDGRYTDVYIAEYGKPYKGNIAKVDQDPDMFRNSKWYRIEDVYKILRPEWQKALVDFKYVSETYMDNLDTLKSILEESYDKPYTYDEIVKYYGKETADKLASDPAHKYRMNTGIELIHQEPTIDELNRIWDNWNRMDISSKKKSDKKSKELFGIDNNTHYNQLIKLYEDSIEQINYDEIIDYPIPEVVPYFTPQELENLGVFNENPEQNYYNTKSTLESKEWFKTYKVTGYPGYKYSANLAKLYEEVIQNPTNYNKQRLLEFGWNPEIPLQNETTLHQNIVKEALYNTYNVSIITVLK